LRSPTSASRNRRGIGGHGECHRPGHPDLRGPASVAFSGDNRTPAMCSVDNTVIPWMSAPSSNYAKPSSPSPASEPVAARLLRNCGIYP
jgi:hypothetical protein